ncbi:MAG: glutamate synthase subunit alpha, partial [Dehalococcoidia bacterium]|nr:glutamate synthase subunit alpha [Dehalococcoidia bacterium]
MMGVPGLPPAQGLYDPAMEHDSCGVGFIAHLKGTRTHRIVSDGLLALENLDHRGASGSEPNTGDGAGLLIQIPDAFFRDETSRLGFALPEMGAYGVGVLFAPKNEDARRRVTALLTSIIEDEAQTLLGWRDVPTDAVGADIGASALSAEPHMLHVFIGRAASLDQDQFERRLYVIRKRYEKAVATSRIAGAELIYLPSLSSRTLIYKGMLTALQLRMYFPDLRDPRLVSAMAMFHSRFSTNTFPSWKLAHPYRMIAHNGEINTLRGNINWMTAREALFASPLYDDVQKILPVVMDEGGSDTAILDHTLELLVQSGWSLPHAMMLLIPEAWSGHTTMPRAKQQFYEYYSTVMEPWDGPASVTFTDGRSIGAVLDRNGLRPSRYIVTKDDIVLMASEVGVLPIEPERILMKGRLQPGKMFLVSLAEGRIIDDTELKMGLAESKPYGDWLADHMHPLSSLAVGSAPPRLLGDELLTKQIAFGYTLEDLKYILGPMVSDSEESTGSMGSDTPLAVLSTKAQPLYNYFQQLFAQVTNPPLDAIREELVTSVETVIGPEGNLLDQSLSDIHLVKLDNPFIDNEQMAQIKALKDDPHFRTVVIPMLFP